MVDPNSLQGIEDEITKKKTKLRLSTDQEERKKLKQEIQDLTDKKNIIEFDTNFNSGSYDKLIQSIDKATDAADDFKTSALSGNAVIDANNKKITDNNNEINRLTSVLKQLQEQYQNLGDTIKREKGLDIDTTDEVSEYNKLGNAIDTVSDKISNLKDENKALVTTNKKTEKSVKKNEKRMDKLAGTADSLSSISDIFGDISSVTKGTEKAVFKVTQTLLTGSSQIISQIEQIKKA